MMVRNRNIKLQLSVLALFLSFMAVTAYGQFGEVAGQLHTNVSVGSSNSITFTLINDGSTPIRFQIITPPQFQSASSNTVPPTVTTNPMNGTIAPNSEFTINVLVSVPAAKNNTPGTQWVGVLQAVVVSNSSSLTGSGANIHEGVAKIITITAIAPQPSILPYVVAAVLAVVIIGGVGYWYYKRNGKVTGRKAKTTGARKRQTVARTRTRKPKGRKTSSKGSTARKRTGSARSRRARRRRR